MEKIELRESLKARDPLLTSAEKAEFTKYVFPFENLVMEGGGCKGPAYVGTIRVLEEIGVLQNIKRFAGASVGSIVALFAALGYDSYVFEHVISQNLQTLMYDASWGSVSLLPNLKKTYGWHPGKKFLEWLRSYVKIALDNPDATFADLYKQTGRELCVVAVNVSQMDCQYFHVKTTPDMPLALAVRMSCSIPGLFAPVKYNLHGAEEYYCDGGLLCNYPLHAYDGWYLSLKPEDSFLQRIPDLNDITTAWDTNFKFGAEANRKTFGILLFSESEEEMFKVQLMERIEKYNEDLPKQPDTILSRKYKEECSMKTHVAERNEQMSLAMGDFLNLIKDFDNDNSGTLDKNELRQALETAGSKFTSDQQAILFGKNLSCDELFDLIDSDGDGEITTRELIGFAEQRGMEVRKMFRGFDSRKIENASGYFDAVLNTMLLNLMKLTLRGEDLHRSLGINGGYVKTMDFNLEKADRRYLIQQGKVACMAFLREHLDRYELAEKESNGQDHPDGRENTTDLHIKLLSKKKSKPKFYSIIKRKSKKGSIFVRHKPVTRTISRKNSSISREVLKDKPATKALSRKNTSSSIGSMKNNPVTTTLSRKKLSISWDTPVTKSHSRKNSSISIDVPVTKSHSRKNSSTSTDSTKSKPLTKTISRKNSSISRDSMKHKAVTRTLSPKFRKFTPKPSRKSKKMRRHITTMEENEWINIEIVSVQE